MKKRFLIIPLLLMVMGAFSQSTIAVVDFNTTNSSFSSMGVTMTELFQLELVKSSNLSVVDRKNVEKILKELKFQLSGFTDPKTIKTIGKQLNVDLLIYCSTSIVGNELYLIVNMIDIETAKIVYSEKMSIKEWEDYTNGVSKFAAGFINKIISSAPITNKFVGVWEGSYTGKNYDYQYIVTLNKNKKCNVKVILTNDLGARQEQEGNGTYSSDSKIFKLNSSLSPLVGGLKRLNWSSIFSFGNDGNDYNTFNILIPDENNKQIGISFSKTEEIE